MGSARRWSPEDDRRLIQMIAVEKRTPQAAADELRRSLNATERQYRTLIKTMDVENLGACDRPLFRRVDTPKHDELPSVLWAKAMGRLQ